MGREKTLAAKRKRRAQREQKHQRTEMRRGLKKLVVRVLEHNGQAEVAAQVRAGTVKVDGTPPQLVRRAHVP